MENVKAMDCPIRLTIAQWSGVLKCLKQHHPDNKTIVETERGLRTQVDLAIEQCRDQLYDEIFGYDDSEAETQEIPIVKSEELPLIEEGGLYFDEEDEPECQFGKTELFMMAGLCFSFLGLVGSIVV